MLSSLSKKVSSGLRLMGKIALALSVLCFLILPILVVFTLAYLIYNTLADEESKGGLF